MLLLRRLDFSCICELLRLLITCGLCISKLNRQMRFSLLSIKCSAAPLASDNCRARGNQIAELCSNNDTVLGSSRKLGGAAEHLIDGSKKRICRLSFEL